jgi:hypothetical protein
MPAKIIYNGSTIASLEPGQIATVGAKETVMPSDIVVDMSRMKGGSYDEGVEAGRQAEHDAFWDAYQQNGSRTNYGSAFGGIGWNDTSFAPKYDMQPINAGSMFANSIIIDLPSALEKAGVTLDFSKATTATQAFLDAKAKHIGVVDMSSCGYLNYLFAYAVNLETIDKVVFSNNLKSIVYAFEGCTSLKNISFDGIIPISISFAQSSLLTTASVQSIIDHLKDLTGATAQTLTLHATVAGNMTAEQKAAITAKNWTLVY